MAYPLPLPTDFRDGMLPSQTGHSLPSVPDGSSAKCNNKNSQELLPANVLVSFSFNGINVDVYLSPPVSPTQPKHRGGNVKPPKQCAMATHDRQPPGCPRLFPGSSLAPPRTKTKRGVSAPRKVPPIPSTPRPAPPWPKYPPSPLWLGNSS